MKFSTNFEGTSVLGGGIPCSISHVSTNIIIMNCQTPSQTFLKPSSRQQPNFCHSTTGTRQFHTSCHHNHHHTEINKMVQQICQPIAAAVLTYAEAVKSEKR